MATIITKNSQTASAVPSAASLAVGELAVNTADGKLYTEHTGGIVKEIIPSTVADGGITLAKLSATGTPSSTTYLRGDNTWASVAAGFSGATSTTSSTDITLTNTSAQIQTIEFSTTGRFVILPNATTLTEGTYVFVIKNNGSIPFGIKDSQGNVLVASVGYGQSSRLELIDNSTAAGNWDIPVALFEILNSSISSTNTDKTICWLSTTSFVLAQMGSGNTFVSLRVGTISGSTVSFGTEVTSTIPSSSIETLGNCVALSSTSFLLEIGYNISGTVTSTVKAFTVSGTTITVGSSWTTIDSNTNNFVQSTLLLPLTSTTCLAFTGAAPAQTSKARVLSVSGTTITAGSLVSVPNGIESNVTHAVVLSSTAVVYAMGGRRGVASISGTTVSFGTQTSASYSSLNDIPSYVLPVNSTSAVLGSDLITVSGTSISSVVSVGSSPLGHKLVKGSVIFGIGARAITQDLQFFIQKYGNGSLSPQISSIYIPTAYGFTGYQGWGSQRFNNLFSPLATDTGYYACTNNNVISFLKIKVYA